MYAFEADNDKTQWNITITNNGIDDTNNSVESTVTLEKELVNFYSMNVRKERKFKKGLITETIFDVKFDDQWNGRKV